MMKKMQGEGSDIVMADCDRVHVGYKTPHTWIELLRDASEAPATTSHIAIVVEKMAKRGEGEVLLVLL